MAFIRNLYFSIKQNNDNCKFYEQWEIILLNNSNTDIVILKYLHRICAINKIANVEK